jgi:hypothetical protein
MGSELEASAPGRGVERCDQCRYYDAQRPQSLPEYLPGSCMIDPRPQYRRPQDIACCRAVPR